MKELIKGVSNTVFVHVSEEEKFIDKKSDFIIDTSWDAAQHVKGVGIIVGIPQVVTGFECEGIQIDFDLGDECIFHYNMISDENNNYYVGKFDGYDVYRCELFNLICTRKKKEDRRSDPWTMVGGWVLCDPHFEQETTRISYIDPLYKNTHELDAIVSPSGIIESVDVKPSTKTAKLINIGKKIDGFFDLDVKAGDLVIFMKEMDSQIIIDGRMYYYMRQEELFAKYTLN